MPKVIVNTNNNNNKNQVGGMVVGSIHISHEEGCGFNPQVQQACLC